MRNDIPVVKAGSIRHTSMRVSLVMLTYNRASLLQRVMDHNLTHAGSCIDELVWVDNGSTDGTREVMHSYHPDACVLNKVNIGVFKGYNRGFALATGDYIVITDDDMLMPKGWLASFRTYLTTITNTGVACYLWDDPNLVAGNVQESHGLKYLPCHPIGRFIVARDLLVKKIGYLREDFGLYGLGDIEWARRAVRVCKQEGLLAYAIPAPRSVHIGTAACDQPGYREFKRREGEDPSKMQLLRRCHLENYPYYNPFT